MVHQIEYSVMSTLVLSRQRGKAPAISLLAGEGRRGGCVQPRVMFVVQVQSILNPCLRRCEYIRQGPLSNKQLWRSGRT